MRRLAVVVMVLAVVLLAGGAVADRVLHGRAEAEIASQVRNQVDVGGEPEVVIEGFPFLTQVLAGSLAEVRGSASRVVVEDVPLEDVLVSVRGVTTAEPYVAETVEINATLSIDTLRSALEEAAPSGGPSLDVDGGELALELDVVGVEIAVGVVPVAAGTDVVLELAGVSIGGTRVSAEDLPDVVTNLLDDWRLAVPGLPEGLELTRLHVLDDGVRVRAEGHDVDLTALGG